MEKSIRRVDADRVKFSTYFSNQAAKKAVANAQRFTADTEKQKRLVKGLCGACYYFRAERIGGQAITRQPCGICEQQVTYSNTATDVMCQECALKHELCKQCGADVHLRSGRVFEP